MRGGNRLRSCLLPPLTLTLSPRKSGERESPGILWKRPCRGDIGLDQLLQHAQKAASADARAGASFFARVSAFYAAIFLVVGTHMPFLPIWLDWRGLSAAEIGLVFSAPYFIRLIVTPSVAFLADRRANHRGVIIVLAWGALASLLAMAPLRSFWPILCASSLFTLFWSTVMPLTETVAMRGVRTAGLDYGRMRLWGSVSFIAASLGGGFIVDWGGPPAALGIILVGAAATLIVAHLLPRAGPNESATPAAGSRLRLADAVRLIGNPLFLLFLFAIGMEQASHAVFYLFGTLHWRAQGYSAGTAGMLWAIAVVSEIGVFAYSSWCIGRVGILGLMLLGAAAGIVRWTAMALDPPLGVQMLLQTLHALTYGAAHLGAIHFIGKAVPQAQAGTAQALYATVTSGIAMGIAMGFSGPVYSVYGGGAYLGMAALAVGALLATLLLRRHWKHGLLIAGAGVAAQAPR